MKLPSGLIDELTPGPDEVRVFFIEHAAPIGDAVRGLISRSEREHCNRYIDERDQIAVATSSGLLRLGLGVLLERDPGEVRVVRDGLGRPLIEGVDRELLDLSVSRTRGCSVLALSRGARCGVDVECIEPGIVREDLVEQVFGDALAIDASRFFERWCSIEAVLKGDGRGLRDGVGAARLIGVNTDSGARWECGGKTWLVRAIQTPAGFVSRLATCTGVEGAQITHLRDGRVRVSRILCAPEESGSP